jgi:dihydroflavonol-4-reductase
MRALVTGSTGCVGSNLVAALNKCGIEVVGLRWKDAPTIAVEGLDLDLIAGDVLDIKTLRPAMVGVDWVFHVAAIADDWNHTAEAIYRTNVEGTYNVLTAAYEAGVERFVLTGSAVALGVPAPDMALLDESCRFNLRPRKWVYGHSKHLAEQVMAEFVARGMHAVSVLPTIILGPGDQTFIAGQLLTHALKREMFTLPEGGSNFIDVRDAAQAHISAAENGRPGERYVLGGHNMTHAECLGIIGDVLGVRVKLVQVPHCALPAVAEGVALLRKWGVKLSFEQTRVLLSGRFMYYDSSKAVRELGLRVRPFAETVRDTFLWYASHGLLEKQGVPASVIAPAWQGVWAGGVASRSSS